jgi:Essential protein Yae1, N terminal
LNPWYISSKCSSLPRYLEFLQSYFSIRFYDAGYEDGFAHGRIHGLIEGRALGREKGFEMWEELGYYEGFANMWKVIYVEQGRSDESVFSW